MRSAHTSKPTARDSTPPAVDLTSGRRVVRSRKGRERVTLRAIREGMGKTQAEIASALETDQGEISRIERRPDVLLSTLRRYAEALGGTCEIAIVFPKTGHRVLVGDPESGESPR